MSMKIHIVEERWSVDRKTGIRSTEQTDEMFFEPSVGAVIEMPIGRRKFIVDAVDVDGITVTAHYENNPSADKTMVISRGENVVYRPMSRDGGYKYTFAIEEISEE